MAGVLVNLNRAYWEGNLTQGQTGLYPYEIRKIKDFLNDNGFLVDKRELVKHGMLTERRYDDVKSNLQVNTSYSMRKESKYGETMTRQTYRHHNPGIQSDWDVGHIIAENNKGADSQYNYVPMYRGYNRKLHDLHDGVVFAFISKEELKNVVRASRAQKGCKLTFKEAWSMRNEVFTNCQELALYKEGQGLVGGVETTDGDTQLQLDRSLLCEQDYCVRLVQAWTQ